MNRNEYGGLFRVAQKKGNYQMHVFDVKDSKMLSERFRMGFYEKIIRFTNAITEDLLKLEEITRTKILHRHSDEFVKVDDDEYAGFNKIILNKNQGIILNKTKDDFEFFPNRLDLLNPLWYLGDAMSFIVLRGSITEKQFLSIAQKHKDNIIPDYDLHYANGYYETDDWEMGYKQLFRGHCFQHLNQVCKSTPLITTKNLEK